MLLRFYSLLMNQSMRLRQKSSQFKGTKVVAVILMFIGGLFTMSTCSALFDSANTDKISLIIGMIILGIIPLGGGIVLFRNVRNSEKRNNVEFTERIILSLASKNNGTLTPLVVAQNTTFNSEESKVLLDQFVIKGHAQIEVNEYGAIEYQFTDFLK